METWNIKFIVFLLLSTLFCCVSCQGGLKPRGRNVCVSPSGGVQCCSGWAQQGEECLMAICEGNFTCKENEVCVRPNECRCRHGYFGASCDTKCPSQFWGPDCKGKCSCHPNGQCDDVTGACTCNPNRWGPTCELPCGCQKGTCNQDSGACTCYSGFWGKQCSNNCYCSVNSVCDLATGQCHCNPGWYGRNCNAQCACNGSPCEQLTGRCKCRERLWGTRCERMCQCVHGRCNQADGTCTCRPGFRGKFCREPCPAGFYGQNCRNRCGHCKGQQPCKVTEGRCVTCERGWNGTRCDQMCANGFFGENCLEVCPPCKDGHFCNRIDGKCPHCNPGWMGDRCEIMCPNGTYGDNCANECRGCSNGTCHHATGECLCHPGFHGAFCNESCSAGQYGVNCAQTCSCHDNNCDPVSGACTLQPNQRMGVIAAGVLVAFLLLLLLSLLCCCCLCSQNNLNSGSEKTTKWRLCGGFTRISSKLPRIPLRRQKLPKVVVSHHDPENTFNCSFIEPPSAVEHPSPPCSSRDSYTSAETTEDCPVYSIHHDAESCKESVEEIKKKGDRINTTETTLLADDDDVSEVETLPEDLPTAEPTPASPSQPLPTAEPTPASPSQLLSTAEPPPASPSQLPTAEPTPASPSQLLTCHKAAESEEGSCSGSESASSTSQPLVRQPNQTLNKEQDTSEGTSRSKDNGKPKAAEKVKPRPPDPATKPKVSWIHGSKESSPNQTSQPETAIEERKTSSKKSSKHISVSPQGSPDVEEASASGETRKPWRSRTGLMPLGHINGALQNVLRQISSFRADRKAANSEDSTEPQKSPSSFNTEALQPHINSEAAQMLAAQLKEKTQSLSRSEGTGGEDSGQSHLQAKKKKPTPPQKTRHGAGKAVTSGSGSVLDTPSKEAKSPEREDSGSGEKADPTVKKTPIKKPPRKKGKEGHSDTKTKTEQKIETMPPQSEK